MVDKRKVLVFVLLGMFLFSMVGVWAIDTTNTGSAYVGNGDGVAEGAKILYEGVATVVQSFFADTIIGDEMLSRIFMAVLLAMFVYTAFGSFFSSSEKIRWIATIATTALALIGLPDSFLQAIRLGYAGMGGAILSVIPFAIILWFTVKVGSLLIARITWLFFTLYYFALYLSVIGSQVGKVGFFEGAAIPYGIAVIGGVIAFFFILKVRDFIFQGEMETVVENGNRKATERKHRLALEMERLKADE